MSSVLTSIPLANYATGLGKYDSAILSANANLAMVESGTATGAALGSGDVSFNTGWVLNPTTFTMPAAVAGNGVSFSGWFWPTQAGSGRIMYIDTSNVAAPISIFMTGTGSVTGTTLLSATYNGTTVTTSDPCFNIVLRKWNYYCFTVECSGSSVAAMSLHVNGGLYSGVATGTYSPQTWIASYLGAGAAGSNPFVGKLDDVRSFLRVLRPMEIAVLYGYAASKRGGSALVPQLSVLGMTTAMNGNGTIASNTFSIAPTSVFSYMVVQRNVAFASGNSTQYVSAAAIQHLSGGWVWTDGGYNSAVPCVYSIVPYAMGVPAQLGTQVANLPVITGITYQPASAAIVFTVQGYFVTYSVYRGGSLVASNVSTSTYTDSGLTAVTSYSYAFLPYNVSGNVGSTFSLTGTTTPQFIPTFSYTFAASNFTNGYDTKQGAQFNCVMVKNTMTSLYSMEIVTSGGSGYPLQVTDAPIQALLNVLPVNPKTGTRGMLVGNVGGQKQNAESSVQTALSSVTRSVAAVMGGGNGATSRTPEYIVINNIGFSMSLWMCITPAVGIQYQDPIVCLSTGSPYFWFTSGNSGISVITSRGSNSTWFNTITFPAASLTVPSSWANIVWNHLAVTFACDANGTTGTLKLYFNGELYSTNPNQPYPQPGNYAFSIASRYPNAFAWEYSGPGPSNSMYGMDKALYYPFILTDSYIQNIYNNLV